MGEGESMMKKIWCEEANEHDVELALQWKEIYGVN